MYVLKKVGSLGSEARQGLGEPDAGVARDVPVAAKVLSHACKTKAQP